MKTMRVFVFLVLALSFAACNLPFDDRDTNQADSTAIPQSPTKTGSAPVAVTNTPVPAKHHIGVRVVNGVGEFYNRITGEKFIPRGMNYVRLASQTKMDGSSTFGHSLFDPGKYNSIRVSGDLSKMHADGYNVVRVFLSPDTMGTQTGGFSQQYMKNIRLYPK
jgi:hypothetical protein